MYMGTMYNRVVALDAETGKEIWVKDIGNTPSTRGIAYWPGANGIPPQLVFGTRRRVVAADFPEREDRRVQSGIRAGRQGRSARRASARNFRSCGSRLSSPPAIYRNLAITGNHSQEAPSLGPSGDVRAWDLRTGKLVWTFHTIPRPGEPNHDAWKNDQWVDRAGANAWGFITVDEARGIAYVPTGTPATDFYGGDRLGSNLYGSSLLALDAATGKLKWFFQTTHHDNWDYDLNAPPTLIDIRRNGRTIPAVAVYTKQGLLFVFDRVTGTPVFGVEERPVVSDNPIPGDEYWPTQPFPVKPPPIARMTFSPNEIAKVTPEHEAYCKGLLELEGGVDDRRAICAVRAEAARDFSGLDRRRKLERLGVQSRSRVLCSRRRRTSACSTRWSRANESRTCTSAAVPTKRRQMLGTNFWDGRKSWPCQQPPWGELVAVNVNTGDIAWRVPLGSFEELDALGVPRDRHARIAAARSRPRAGSCSSPPRRTRGSARSTRGPEKCSGWPT